MHAPIQTDRLTLRLVALTDAPNFSRIGGDPNVARMSISLTTPYPVLCAEMAILIKLSRHKKGLSVPYAITEPGGPFIGMVELFRSKTADVFEFGYHIDRAFNNRGLITEACKAMMDTACRELGEIQFIANVFEDNPASMRVLEKLGFVKNVEKNTAFSFGRMELADGYSFDHKMKLQ